MPPIVTRQRELSEDAGDKAPAGGARTIQERCSGPRAGRLGAPLLVGAADDRQSRERPHRWTANLLGHRGRIAGGAPRHSRRDVHLRRRRRRAAIRRPARAEAQRRPRGARAVRQPRQPGDASRVLRRAAPARHRGPRVSAAESGQDAGSLESSQPRPSQDHRRRRARSASPAASTSTARTRAPRPAGPGPSVGSRTAGATLTSRSKGPRWRSCRTLFFESWQQAGAQSELDEKDKYFPTIAPAGDDLVTIVANDSESDDRSLYGTYLAAFTCSSKRLWITHAYFAPNEELLTAMIDAAQRGVDVRLIVPAFTDSRDRAQCHASDIHTPAEGRREDLRAEGRPAPRQERRHRRHRVHHRLRESRHAQLPAQRRGQRHRHQPRHCGTRWKRCSSGISRPRGPSSSIAGSGAPLWQRTKEFFVNMFSYWI